MTEDFEDPTPPRGLDDESDEGFVLRLETYEGPIDVLLDQAREQKVDLTQISILALADQYLGFVERARRLRPELAADYLVMARSEENTSELQSLMRISYAVFCLKKKNKNIKS